MAAGRAAGSLVGLVGFCWAWRASAGAMAAAVARKRRRENM